MRFEDKIGLILSGFSPDSIGEITALLNRRFAISEDVVRGILVEDEAPFSATYGEYEKKAFLEVLDELATQEVRPRLNFVIGRLAEAFQKMGLDPNRAVPLGEYLWSEWDDLLILADIPDKYPDEESGELPVPDEESSKSTVVR